MRFKLIAAIIIELILAGAIKAVKAQVPLLISVEKIEITGNTIFDSELEAIVVPLEGREVSLEQILELRGKLTNYYIEQGYTTSGAFLPPQKFTDGQIRIQIIEGTLETIKIKGLKNLSGNYLKSRLPQVGKPLNVNHLLQSLGRLQNNPLIQTIKGRITQSSLGKNVLLLNVEENNPLSAQIYLTNAYSPSIGSFGGNARIVHQNLLGFGDRLTIDHSQTEGLRRTGGSYSFPFNRLDGRIIFAYNNANSELVEDEVEDLGIEADYESFSLKIEQPIIYTSTESLTLSLGIEQIDSETFVLNDFSFAFTDGLTDGRSKITALRFTQEYEKKGASTLFIVNSQFSVGLDLFDATTTDVGIDGSFWNWRGDIQWLKAFNEEKDLVLATRLNIQLTPDQLLPFEQITIGGLGSVRGYRPSIGVADNAVIETIELRIPLIRGDWGKIQVIPFFDVGDAWNNKRETTGSNTFASSGLGLRYRFREAFELRLNYAIPIIEAKDFGETDTEDNFTFAFLFYPLKF
ncbi:MAG: ShlB/FhaC/HecB family hemolysin secretion/activation protein [Xenococcaceae cyanobacterium MO_188.B29]|nr:ShlB/FhaC/HecB family hemolysin secretion/activation protein [Xenococcaceae cyanobacterium MO_188.B29]